jgi:hypothetical protein
MNYSELPDPKKQSDGTWAVQYETKDDAGKVIATTTFVGSSERECWKKMQAAHVEATAALERLRRRNNAKPADLGTAEEEAFKARKAAINANEQSESFTFLKRHLYTGDYNQCDANASLIRSYLESKGLVWTADNLEVAFEELTRAKRLVPPSTVAVETPAAVVEEKQIEVPWATPLTKKGVLDMDRASYKEFYNNRNEALRNEFRRQVDLALKGEQS